MPRGTIAVQHPEGLHARPAAEFVKLANRFKSTITLRLNGREANGKSIMSVMGLGANMGAQVDLDVHGEDEDQAFQALTSYLTERTT